MNKKPCSLMYLTQLLRRFESESPLAFSYYPSIGPFGAPISIEMHFDHSAFAAFAAFEKAAVAAAATASFMEIRKRKRPRNARFLYFLLLPDSEVHDTAKLCAFCCFSALFGA